MWQETAIVKCTTSSGVLWRWSVKYCSLQNWSNYGKHTCTAHQHKQMCANSKWLQHSAWLCGKSQRITLKWKGEKWNPLKLTQNNHTICWKIVGWPPTEFYVSTPTHHHTSSLWFCRTNAPKWKQKRITSPTAALNDRIP